VRRKLKLGFVSQEPLKQNSERSDGPPETGFVPHIAPLTHNQKAA